MSFKFSLKKGTVSTPPDLSVSNVATINSLIVFLPLLKLLL